MIPTKEDMIKELLSAPGKLYDAENKILQHKKELEKLKDMINAIEAVTASEVLEDSKKEELKESLSNKEKRDSEKTARLKDNKQYMELIKELHDQEESYQKGMMALKLDERNWQGLKAVAYLMASRG